MASPTAGRHDGDWQEHQRSVGGPTAGGRLHLSRLGMEGADGRHNAGNASRLPAVPVAARPSMARYWMRRTSRRSIPQRAVAMTSGARRVPGLGAARGHPVLSSGAWITPELAARRCASGNARAVFIDEPEEQEILNSMLQRSGRTEPLPRQLSIWARGLALRQPVPTNRQRHGVPLVGSSTRTNARRPHHRSGRIGDTK